LPRASSSSRKLGCQGRMSAGVSMRWPAVHSYAHGDDILASSGALANRLLPPDDVSAPARSTAPRQRSMSRALRRNASNWAASSQSLTTSEGISIHIPATGLSALRAGDAKGRRRQGRPLRVPRHGADSRVAGEAASARRVPARAGGRDSCSSRRSRCADRADRRRRFSPWPRSA